MSISPLKAADTSGQKLLVLLAHLKRYTTTASVYCITFNFSNMECFKYVSLNLEAYNAAIAKGMMEIWHCRRNQTKSNIQVTGTIILILIYVALLYFDSLHAWTTVQLYRT
jgi:hypothetical protein